MLAVKSTHLKTILSMALAILLAISVLPMLTYNASAASYYSVTGTVTDATMNTITVLSNDKYRHFGKSNAKVVNATNGIALGDIVKITYSANNKQEAVQITMLSHSSSANRTPHETATYVAIVGSVRDMSVDSITVLSEGRRRTFSTENTTVLNAPDDGILVGDRIRVIYYSNNTSEAVQILMVSPGENHYSDSGYTYDGPVSNRSFTGWISDMGDHYIRVQDLQNGRSITFYYNENDSDNPELAIGDTVKVLYNDDHPGTALRIVMVDEGNNH